MIIDEVQSCAKLTKHVRLLVIFCRDKVKPLDPDTAQDYKMQIL